MITRTILISVALAMSLLVAPTVDALLIENEDAYEVFSKDVILPSENVGNLILKPCSTCSRVVLRVNAGSQAFIGKEQVTFLELKKKAASANKTMYVFFTIDEKVVTRVVLRA